MLFCFLVLFSADSFAQEDPTTTNADTEQTVEENNTEDTQPEEQEEEMSEEEKARLECEDERGSERSLCRLKVMLIQNNEWNASESFCASGYTQTTGEAVTGRQNAYCKIQQNIQNKQQRRMSSERLNRRRAPRAPKGTPGTVRRVQARQQIKVKQETKEFEDRLEQHRMRTSRTTRNRREEYIRLRQERRQSEAPILSGEEIQIHLEHVEKIPVRDRAGKAARRATQLKRVQQQLQSTERPSRRTMNRIMRMGTKGNESRRTRVRATNSRRLPTINSGQSTLLPRSNKSVAPERERVIRYYSPKVLEGGNR